MLTADTAASFHAGHFVKKRIDFSSPFSFYRLVHHVYVCVRERGVGLGGEKEAKRTATVGNVSRTHKQALVCDYTSETVK